jgi:CRP-like cAMP-binding protein
MLGNCQTRAEGKGDEWREIFDDCCSRATTVMIDVTEYFAGSGLIDADKSALSAPFTAKTIDRDGYFIRAGDESVYFGIVEKGLFRSFYIDDRGHDITKGFFPAGSILFSYAAYVDNTASAYSIQALEDCSILVARIEELEGVIRDRSALIGFVKDVFDRVMIEKERRSNGFVLLDSAGRYLRFLRENPGLEARIRQYHLASYLGITPVSLSRLRKRLSVIKR